jgi:hypothetical protein
MIRAVKKLKAEGKTTFLCLSSANTVYISTVLEVNKKFIDTTSPIDWPPIVERSGKRVRRNSHQSSRMGSIWLSHLEKKD